MTRFNTESGVLGRFLGRCKYFCGEKNPYLFWVAIYDSQILRFPFETVGCILDIFIVYPNDFLSSLSLWGHLSSSLSVVICWGLFKRGSVRQVVTITSIFLSHSIYTGES
jgi:hypothetical protein